MPQQYGRQGRQVTRTRSTTLAKRRIDPQNGGTSANRATIFCADCAAKAMTRNTHDALSDFVTSLPQTTPFVGKLYVENRGAQRKRREVDIILFDSFFLSITTHSPFIHPNTTQMALFLGRLAPDTRPRDLEDLFAKYGKVVRLDIKRGKLSSFMPKKKEKNIHMRSFFFGNINWPKLPFRHLPP
jgi:hypothetical protein